MLEYLRTGRRRKMMTFELLRKSWMIEKIEMMRWTFEIVPGKLPGTSGWTTLPLVEVSGLSHLSSPQWSLAGFRWESQQR